MLSPSKRSKFIVKKGTTLKRAHEMALFKKDTLHTPKDLKEEKRMKHFGNFNLSEDKDDSDLSELSEAGDNLPAHFRQLSRNNTLT